MKIEFDTATLDPREARGLTALLAELGGRLGRVTQSVVSLKLDASDLQMPTEADLKQWEANAVADAVHAAIAETGDAILDTSLRPSNLDANGLPWDARIHSSGRTLNKDNTWRYGKGVARELIEQVEAELRAATQIEENGEQEAIVEETVLAAEVNEPEVSDESDPAGRIEAAVSVIPAPPVRTNPLPRAAEESVAGPTFKDLMQRITAEKIPTPRVKEICAAIGVDGVAALIKQPELIPAFYMELEG